MFGDTSIPAPMFSGRMPQKISNASQSAQPTDLAVEAAEAFDRAEGGRGDVGSAARRVRRRLVLAAAAAAGSAPSSAAESAPAEVSSTSMPAPAIWAPKTLIWAQGML